MKTLKKIKAKNRYEKIRDENIKTILEYFNVDKLTCHRCDNHNNEEFAFFDFHHINPEEKDNTISYMMGHVNKEKLLNELEKCEVLCPSCHRKLHMDERKEKEEILKKEINSINLLDFI